jgi:Zn-dependent peptidase ImmA (M78 family)
MEASKNKQKGGGPKTTAQVVRAAEELLDRHGRKIPTHIFPMAKGLGITIQDEDLEEQVSGILLVKEGGHVMAVNKNHPLFRRRFTIAHEIGHFVLHRDQESIFIDDSVAFHLNAHSPNLTKWQEREANLFAAYLLMPEAEIREYMQRGKIDPNDEAALKRMAKYFKVSPQALAIHLGKLKLL